MLRVLPFRPNEDALRLLWERISANRAGLADDFPLDPLGFTCWICATDTAAFTVWEPEGTEPIGLFVFANIQANEAAWAHIFIWNRETAHPRDLVEAARTACAAMFRAFGLVRINGLTPSSNVPARVFAERVGFKIEGTVRDGVSMGGHREAAWLSGLLPSDLPEHGRMEVKETP